MCGIAGYLGQLQPELGARMAATLAHRGPDDAGETVLDAADGSVAVLAHRRLSIIDVEGGHQPIANEDGAVQLVFNGEIYNFAELRRELEQRGHRFRTRADTEVIVHLYEDEGPELVHRLRGMFAFALWDARRQRLVVARDRIGVKPLYYAQPGSGVSLAFASELPALLEVPGVSCELDLESLASYLAFLYVPHPRSAIRGIGKLAPGHMLVAEGGGVEVRRWWKLDPDTSGTGEGDADRMWELLADSVELRLVADVPVGAFLSGGIDSSSIVAAAAERGSRLDTFTVTFSRPEERRYDETEDARAIAAAIGNRHHELPAAADAAELLPSVVRHFGEPFGNPTALLVHELSRLTREHVKVALAGDGADELLAGYPRYRGLAAAAWYRRVPRPMRALAAAGARALPESTSGRHGLRRAREFALAPVDDLDASYVDWITYFDPEDRAALLRPDVAERLRESPPPERFLGDLLDEAPRDDLVNRFSFVELQSFLPCNVLEYGDRMSMAHGLEVRAPYTDHRLVEHVFALPGTDKLRRGRSKAILRDAAAGRIPGRSLTKRKIGFNPPMGLWLRRDLAPLVDSHLSPEVVSARGLFRPEAVSSLVETLRSGRRDTSLHVWSLIVLEQWFRELGVAA
ncbi:MAG TPA: asparagine synthase (glutamine-hydrolyzing) [Gaiellaceae bacterium]|nr:asparagine synthase (glutamine-hydrolyzing) [Gaiellaceae bacterium]